MRIPAEQHELALRIATESKAAAKKASRPKGSARDAMASAREEAKAMTEGGDWSEAQPRHLVALHSLLHEHVYGVEPLMTAREHGIATSCAAGMLRYDFEGNVAMMVEFIRWCWRREAEREQWRRQNGRDGGRLDWRRQFTGKGPLTDYRVELARKVGA